MFFCSINKCLWYPIRSRIYGSELKLSLHCQGVYSLKSKVLFCLFYKCVKIKSEILSPPNSHRVLALHCHFAVFWPPFSHLYHGIPVWPLLFGRLLLYTASSSYASRWLGLAPGVIRALNTNLWVNRFIEIKFSLSSLISSSHSSPSL